jgi:hypothetical protein
VCCLVDVVAQALFPLHLVDSAGSFYLARGGCRIHVDVAGGSAGVWVSWKLQRALPAEELDACMHVYVLGAVGTESLSASQDVSARPCKIL